jgi:hypothetical protein
MIAVAAMNTRREGLEEALAIAKVGAEYGQSPEEIIKAIETRIAEISPAPKFKFHDFGPRGVGGPTNLHDAMENLKGL